MNDQGATPVVGEQWTLSLPELRWAAMVRRAGLRRANAFSPAASALLVAVSASR